MSVRAATHDDVDDCARVLALAFHGDPATVLFEPDPVRRAEILPPFFRAFVAASLPEGGDIYVAGDRVDGVAIWFGPDRYGPSPEAMLAHGQRDVLSRAGPDATQRLLAFTGELERQHELLTDGPHLRLELLGVLPEKQRSGLGSDLIEHGHRRADALGLPCYLDTFTQPNVRYYERQGYEVVGEFAVGDDVPVYAMIRPPRR